MNDSKPAPAHTNRLIEETSPYLLQHAHNPVDWYPWGEEALKKSREENKPIFLSIGYSACHWCHVMEHESFENESIAAIMNEHYVNIKVDREERPDLDDIYMNAVQALTGQGGWPMSVFLTPELKPFYGGTYFPPQDMYGRPGFPTVLEGIARAYNNDYEKVVESSNEITEHLNKSMSFQTGHRDVTYSLIENAFDAMKNRFDEYHGGFGTAPKFPQSMNLDLLLRIHAKTGTREALSIAETTLRKMAEGGMYDQLGGGFHRYSVDAKWLIPHFEKMLYDNALLSKTYIEAWQHTKHPLYKTIATESLDYVLREMTSPEGAFYSTQDADSEGQEGLFFSWTPEQIRSVLGDDAQSELVCRYFGVDEGGNFEHGTSVLHVTMEMESLARMFNLAPEEAQSQIESARKALFEHRESRIKPGRDEKILTDWNGLMISSMALAGRVFNQPTYTEAARSAVAYIFNTMFVENRLLHTAKDGQAHTNGFLSDYTYLINGLIDCFQTTGDASFLSKAKTLMDITIEQFWDNEQSAFFFTGNDHEQLITRSKDPMDNAVPSGNSMAILALVRLAELTGDKTYHEKAYTSLQLFHTHLEEVPMGFSQMLCGLDFLLSNPRVIVLSASNLDELQPMHTALFDEFFPHIAIICVTDETRAELESLTPLVADKLPVEGKPTAYVCQNFTCQQPATTVEELLLHVKS